MKGAASSKYQGLTTGENTNNSINTTQVVDQARRALVLHEPRIDVLDVTAESTPERPNLLLIRIGYRIRENNALGNFVYPFFVTEGA